MKRLSVFLVLITLAVQGIAQEYGDMPFFINFTASSNSPPNFTLQGHAEYFRSERWPPYYPPSHYYTNKLDVDLEFPSPPENVRFLEKQADGSLSPLAVTPISGWDYSDSNDLDESFALTTNQVLSLIAGNWYVEVDFGDSNYLGNVAPQYGFANGPTAFAEASPAFPAINMNPNDLLLFTNYGYTAIARNNRSVAVVFDASQSIDPFYLPMQYAWACWTNDFEFGTPLFTSTNLLATNVFALGFYVIGLQVDDGLADGGLYSVTLQVSTASQVLAPLISGIADYPMSKFERKALTDMISSAKTLFNRGNVRAGVSELKRYQNSISALRFDILTTFYFLQPAQEVIDAF